MLLLVGSFLHIRVLPGTSEYNARASRTWGSQIHIDLVIVHVNGGFISPPSFDCILVSLACIYDIHRYSTMFFMYQILTLFASTVLLCSFFLITSCKPGFSHDHMRFRQNLRWLNTPMYLSVHRMLVFATHKKTTRFWSFCPRSWGIRCLNHGGNTGGSISPLWACALAAGWLYMTSMTLPEVGCLNSVPGSSDYGNRQRRHAGVANSMQCISVCCLT